MPLYKFKCEKCKKETEALSKLGQTNIKCSCGHTAVKMFSPNKTIFQVNGGGAYNSGQMKHK